LNADFLAARSSFQSEERFFILVQRIRKKIFQSGTAIILQTHNPALQVYRFLASGNPEEYYQHELEIRKGLGFPPFGTIIRISTSGKNAESCMSRVIESLQNYGDIYEEDKTEKRMLSILWKVPDKQRAIYMLSELLQTQKIRNISIDIDSQF
jgi:primosomal protein N'